MFYEYNTKDLKSTEFMRLERRKMLINAARNFATAAENGMSSGDDIRIIYGLMGLEMKDMLPEMLAGGLMDAMDKHGGLCKDEL